MAVGRSPPVTTRVSTRPTASTRGQDALPHRPAYRPAGDRRTTSRSRPGGTGALLRPAKAATTCEERRQPVEGMPTGRKRRGLLVALLDWIDTRVTPRADAQ